MKNQSSSAGILWIIAAVGCLALHDSIARQMVLGLPLAVVIWIRYLGQATVMSATALARGKIDAWRCHKPVVHLARAVFLVALSLTFMGGLRYVPLAQSTALLFLAPLFVLVISRLVFDEQVRLIQWLAVVGGLAGVYLVIQPGAGHFDWNYLWPCAGAFFLSCYQLATRMGARFDNAESATLWLGLYATLLCSLIIPWYWQSPSPTQWIGLIGMGCIGSLAHWFFATAYSKASPALLAPFTYVQVPFSALLGFVFFSSLPTPSAWAGIALIMLSGLIVALPDNKRRAHTLA
ncbi:DMT family transporter [Pseudomonas vanderleydeniana]|uniref:DMT family transporter n=1 Tax=Pseudomonas vanderleydeniana TaxID=2745495 RepID=A0A9E6PR46_9PSED|nr:DMT family transporter [Pseudomonas vanderleydeniana]QXI30932.1 DMT family transporter [Pseudomonas vanderleydeniana]